MTLMVAITGQMLAHENLKYKVGLHKTVSSAAHKFFPTIRGVHGKAKSATAKQLLAALQTEVLAAQ